MASHVEIIESLSKLEDGWYDGDGDSYTADDLKILSNILENLEVMCACVPGLYGDIDLVWNISEGRVVVTLEEHVKNACLYVINKGRVLYELDDIPIDSTGLLSGIINLVVKEYHGR